MKFIYQVVADFVDEDGCQVQQRKHVTGAIPEHWSEWCSFATLMLQTPMGPASKRFEIPLLSCHDAIEAFAAIEACSAAAKERAVAEMEEEIRAVVQEKSGALWDPSKGPPGPQRIVGPEAS